MRAESGITLDRFTLKYTHKMSTAIAVSTAIVSNAAPAITVTVPVAATPLAPNKILLKVRLSRYYSPGNKFASSASMGDNPQFVTEHLIRVATRIGILSSLASYEDAVTLVACYLNNLRIMTPAVIAGDISPECAVINAL